MINYFSKDGRITATAIKAGARSMRHMRYAMTECVPDSPAMRWGRLAHMAVLEPYRLATLPVWQGGRKAGEAWEAFMRNIQGLDYSTREEYAKLCAMSAAMSIDALETIALATSHETEIIWEDDLAGPCKAKIDAHGNGVLVEIKTARDVTERAFGAAAARMGYHLQLGWYARAIRCHTGEEITSAYVVAIENVAPWTCAVYRMDADVLRWAEGRAVRIAKDYRTCEAANAWPQSQRGVQPYPLPDWLLEGEEAPEWMTEGEGEL